MTVKVDVSGVSALKVALTDLRGRIESEVASAVEDEASAAADDAKANVRVDTGDLRDSIAAQVDGMSATVGPRAEFMEGPFVKAVVNEFGRSREPGQPYMLPAAEQSRQRWPKRAQDAVKRAAR